MKVYPARRAFTPRRAWPVRGRAAELAGHPHEGNPGFESGALQAPEGATTVIRVENLSVRAGAFTLEGVSFAIETGDYAILMGRTGSGKTTILEALCGLKTVTAGRILLNGRDVTRLKPGERNIGFVPQEAALFATMSVREQIGFALTVRGWKQRDKDRRVNELAELLGVQSLLNRQPEGLSGGERQRVALGRALAANPAVLCLDEPLSALDDASREEMYRLLRSVREHTGVTTLHITHSRAEARRLGHFVFLLDGGQVRRAEIDEVELEEDSPAAHWQAKAPTQGA